VNSAASVSSASLLAARMSLPTSDLTQLTRALARGDNAAWLRFHREFGPVIFRQLLARTTGNYDVATEALQQVYLRVARAVRPCDSEPQFRAWLRLVTRSTLQDAWRRQGAFQRMRERFRAEPPRGPEADADDDGPLLHALDQALAKLKPEDCRLLSAKYLDGETVAQLAARLGISVKAVESRLSRARAELRSRLAQYLQSPDASA
jgi:RNA polymerase sigma-70 factor (ECF subfamily)